MQIIDLMISSHHLQEFSLTSKDLFIFYYQVPRKSNYFWPRFIWFTLISVIRCYSMEVLIQILNNLLLEVVLPTVPEIAAGHRSLSGTISCVSRRYRFRFSKFINQQDYLNHYPGWFSCELLNMMSYSIVTMIVVDIINPPDVTLSFDDNPSHNDFHSFWVNDWSFVFATHSCCFFCIEFSWFEELSFTENGLKGGSKILILRGFPKGGIRFERGQTPLQTNSILPLNKPWMILIIRGRYRFQEGAP